MITIGLAGWGDHPELYPAGIGAKHKLHTYSGHFPVVEVDSSFYAIPSIEQYAKWDEATPEGFSFVVKAFQGMTGHLRGPNPFSGNDEMYDYFKSTLEPLRKSDKLKAVLFQFPPWFDCSKPNVALLRAARDRMGDVPVALEFRHQSWFTADMKDKTLDYMRQDGWIHSICDEPQAGMGSIPIVPVATDEGLSIVRFHGRNVQGWNSSGSPDWRDVRYLYRYSDEELVEWKGIIENLEKTCCEVCVIFNNNSGGDASDNAKQLQQLLDLEWQGLAPRQLDLF
ncbi:hypothetical protein SY83_16820 [Paenibacillus swuensis]|uniref:YunF n=1 Tax=Paenibacillus swuensis TaxID=1178515 RepID=A0A172TKV9_9BACL|nr:DUF72 domain-containing protein [Paenibacillus swuensis]ANE47671.1 hypothetical protein SY83_16820 [Paenibacillus swuensis]